MTDEQLEGLAAQAANLAKVDVEKGDFRFLFAVSMDGQLFRMQKVESLVCEKLGEDWLNDGGKKDHAFGLFRKLLGLTEVPEAVIIGTASNCFTFVAGRTTVEQQKEIARAGHDRHHQAVREGLMEIRDGLTVTVQTPDRVCIYQQERDLRADPIWQKAKVMVGPQEGFGGRMKLFGDDDEQPTIV